MYILGLGKLICYYCINSLINANNYLIAHMSNFISTFCMNSEKNLFAKVSRLCFCHTDIYCCQKLFVGTVKMNNFCQCEEVKETESESDYLDHLLLNTWWVSYSLLPSVISLGKQDVQWGYTLNIEWVSARITSLCYIFTFDFWFKIHLKESRFIMMTFYC